MLTVTLISFGMAYLFIDWRFDFQTIDWRTVSVVIAVVGIILAVYFQWWRNRKRLSYEILSDFELVSSKPIRDRIEVLYEGKRVESVHLVVVKLINDGFQPIKKDDFEKPVRFVFRGGTILSAEKEEFHPENIGTEVSYEDHWVEIKPTLFNRKDYIQFKVLLDGYTGLAIDARLVGVSKIGKATVRMATSEKLFMSGFLGMIGYGFYQWIKNPSQTQEMAPIVVAGIAAVVSTLLYILKRKG